MKSAMEFVKAVENRLGWIPPAFGHRARIIETSKVKRRIASDP